MELQEHAETNWNSTTNGPNPALLYLVGVHVDIAFVDPRLEIAWQ